MPTIKKYCTVLFMLTALTGCQDKLTYSYLIEHPDVLLKELDKCERESYSIQKPSERCEIVLQTAANLTASRDDRMRDPENFGQQIIDAEIACVKAKTTLLEVETKLTSLKNQNASATEMATAEEKLKEAKASYVTSRENVKFLLAVISLDGPE